jgi:hypothetical protein
LAARDFDLFFPAVYLILSGVLIGGCLLRLGHSDWCNFFLNSLLPARWLGQLAFSVMLQIGIIEQGSTASRISEEILSVPLPFLLSVIQYYLLGLLVDKPMALGIASSRR